MKLIGELAKLICTLVVFCVTMPLLMVSAAWSAWARASATAR